MKALLVFLIMSLNAQAAIKEIFLPSLDCQGESFRDVTITYNDEQDTRQQLNVGFICHKLRIKLVKKAAAETLNRFVMDELSPQHADQFVSRANDFFKILFFKPDILGKKAFDYTRDDLSTILRNIKNPRKMKIRQFSPAAENMGVIAFQSGGAAYLNSYKSERSACSQINTLVHEYMHFVGYGHQDNNPEGKENSVPYYFGERAQKLCEAGVI